MNAKILIIEDDSEIVESISLSFSIHWPESTIISAYRGIKGIELVQSESPDVVILDLLLPDLSGYEVLKQIRLFSSVPTIILTVKAQEEDVIKALEGEANDYIIKPFRQKELLARVKSQLSARMTRDVRATLI